MGDQGGCSCHARWWRHGWNGRHGRNDVKKPWINPTPISAKLHTEDTNLPQLAPPYIHGLSQVFFPHFVRMKKREIFEHDVRCFCKNISSVLCWFNLIAVNA